MKKRAFLRASAASAVGLLVSQNFSFLYDNHVPIYYDKIFTPENSILFRQIQSLVSEFNRTSSVKLHLVEGSSSNLQHKNISFISSPDNFEFQRTVREGLSDLTFLGTSRTYEEKIKSLASHANRYESFADKLGYTPLFVDVGPDLQASFLKPEKVKKCAVYDNKSYLFANQLGLEQVILHEPINRYFNKFYEYFDSTAPLYFGEFFNVNRGGMLISKDMVTIDHYLSPMLFSIYLSHKDSNTIGAKAVSQLKEMTLDKLTVNSKEINEFLVKNIFT